MKQKKLQNTLWLFIGYILLGLIFKCSFITQGGAIIEN